MTTRVKVTGLTEVETALERLGDGLADMPDVMDEIARDAVRTAAGFAPKRSGRLAGSLRPSTRPGVASVTSSLVYAGPINYGWRAHNIRAARFLQRADTPVEQRAVVALDKGADRLIRKVGLS